MNQKQIQEIKDEIWEAAFSITVIVAYVGISILLYLAWLFFEIAPTKSIMVIVIAIIAFIAVLRTEHKLNKSKEKTK